MTLGGDLPFCVEDPPQVETWGPQRGRGAQCRPYLPLPITVSVPAPRPLPGAGIGVPAGLPTKPWAPRGRAVSVMVMILSTGHTAELLTGC